jgi:hypothetical protein
MFAVVFNDNTMRFFSVFFACCIASMAYGQHAAAPHHQPGQVTHTMKGAHRLTLGLGHTHISEGIIDGKTEWVTAGSWSFNYDYWLLDRWAIGLQNDLVLETFFVEDKEKEVIERSYPWSVVPVAIYKPFKRLSFLGGVGIEFAKEKSLTLTRLGVEYGFHLPKNWEVGAALVWDNKWNYYNSWGLAFTISKIWPKRSH